MASEEAESTTFEQAFLKLKTAEYGLQKTLVDHVLMENYSQADAIKRELGMVMPECSENVRTLLELGRGMFPGQVFVHKKYGYRGVIWKADPSCKSEESWIEMMGVRRMPRGAEQPFYHCLVDQRDRPGQQTTYVAEENIELSKDAYPVEHSLMRTFFIEVPALKCYLGSDALEEAGRQNF